MRNRKLEKNVYYFFCQSNGMLYKTRRKETLTNGLTKRLALNEKIEPDWIDRIWMYVYFTVVANRHFRVNLYLFC